MKKKSLFVLVFLLIFISCASSTYLVNSQDWTDVYSASFQAQSEGETPYFVRSDNLGVFNVLPYGEPVNVVESESSPYIAGIENQLEAQGYKVGNVTTVNDNLDLLEDPDRIIVVPQSFPSASLLAAPYARIQDGEVAIVNRENIEEIESLMQEASYSAMIGDFNREQINTLKDDADEVISSSSKFNLSVKVAKSYLDRKNSTRVSIASGNYISRGITSGKNPVLLSGTNYLPEQLEKFLLENPHHSIRTAVMVGNEMTTVGEEIRDSNISRNGRVTDEKLSVFVKYGQARGDSNSIYAISLFPLPTGDVSLDITSTVYNPESGELLITYRNSGESRMYQLTSFEVVSDEEVIAQGGDDNPVFIGANTNRTVSYDINPDSSLEDAFIEFSTTYGTSTTQLDTYLTESGQFSPPLRKNISVTEIESGSNISIRQVKYVSDLGRFKIAAVNGGDEVGYAQVRLTGVEVRGQEQSFASEKVKIPAGSEKEIFIPVNLDSVDLEENENVRVVLSHGSQEDQLLNSAESVVEFEVVKSGQILLVAAALLLIITALTLLAWRNLISTSKSRDNK